MPVPPPAPDEAHGKDDPGLDVDLLPTPVKDGIDVLVDSSSPAVEPAENLNED